MEAGHHWGTLGPVCGRGGKAVKAKPKSFHNFLGLCFVLFLTGGGGVGQVSLGSNLVKVLSKRRKELLDKDLSVEDVDDKVERDVEEEFLKKVYNYT